MVNQKAIVQLEVEKGAFKYVLLLPMGAPLGSSYDACHEFLQQILEMSKIAVDNTKQNDANSVIPEAS